MCLVSLELVVSVIYRGRGLAHAERRLRPRRVLLAVVFLGVMR